MKTAIIIGVGKGLGFGLVEKFGQEGFHIAMVSRSAAKLEAFQQGLKEKGISSSVHAVDAGNFEATTSALQQIAAEHSVEVLIYNAVVPHFESALKLDPEKMVDNYRVDVAGALNAIQAVLPAMQEQGHGTILLTGAGSALHPWAQAPTITIAKAGVRSLAFMLAEDLQDSPVQVGTVTVMGAIRPDTAFSPDKIANAFFDHYKNGAEGIELTYKG